MAELKVKDHELYRAGYCGLCRALKNTCGQLPRLTLQYDIAFMALALISASEQEAKIVRRSCMLHPFKKHASLEDHPALDYCAALCMLLSAAKTRDNRQDEHSWWAPAALGALKMGERRAMRLLGGTAGQITAALGELYRLEKAQDAGMDALADAFGRALEAAMAAAPVEDVFTKKTLCRMGYYLGRWVYLVDALDDMQKDEQTGSFNPLLTGDRENSRLLAAESCRWSAGQCAQAAELCGLKFGREIMDNIFYLGMEETLARVLSPTRKEV